MLGDCAAPPVSQCHPPPKNVNVLVVEEGGPGCVGEHSESRRNPRNPLSELNALQKEVYNFIRKLCVRWITQLSLSTVCDPICAFLA